MTDTTAAARAVIQALLNGQPPNGIAPETLGSWAEVVTTLVAAHATGGTPAVQRTFSVLARAHRDLAVLIAGSAPTPTAVLDGKCPPLPAAATAIYEQSAPCGQWLDAYSAYARQRAPRTAANFHVAAGLYLTSLAIARRVIVRSVVDVYPNIYVMYVAQSGYGKSTALKIVKTLINTAGLRHLLLMNATTPEALVTQLATKLPPTYDTWEPASRADWLKERAFAAQRGWLLEEASFFFDSLSRDYMRGMLGQLLDFYECPEDDGGRETQTHGRVLVKNLYPTFFGVSTPIEMQPHLRNERFWTGGLWARCILLTPDSDPVWIDQPPDMLHPPASLIAGLHHIYTLFPRPHADMQDDEETGNRFVQVTNENPPHAAVLGDGVYRAWQTYRKAMEYDIIETGAIDDYLRSCYQRWASHAMKVATLLAVMDTEALPVVIEPRHFARAQQLVETWRAGTHRLWAHQTKHEEQILSERVLAKLRTGGPRGPGWTVAELISYTKKSKRQIEDALALLESAGIAFQQSGRATRWFSADGVDSADSAAFSVDM